MDTIFSELEELFDDENTLMITLDSSIELVIDKFKQNSTTFSYYEYRDYLKKINHYILRKNEKNEKYKLNGKKFGVILHIGIHNTLQKPIGCFGIFTRTQKCIYQECTQCKKLYKCINKITKDIHAPYKCKKCNSLIFDFYTPNSMEDF